MSRPEFLEPKGTLDVQLIGDVISLVDCVAVGDDEIESWTPLERALVYDYCMREHLAAANNAVKRRPKPALLLRTGCHVNRETYPVCEHCEKRPAACYGAYESEENRAFACGECCGHGNEDGWCFQLAHIPELVDSRREYYDEKAILLARVAALEEQLKILGGGDSVH
jgi:hypothetical protein